MRDQPRGGGRKWDILASPSIPATVSSTFLHKDVLLREQGIFITVFTFYTAEIDCHNWSSFKTTQIYNFTVL